MKVSERAHRGGKLMRWTRSLRLRLGLLILLSLGLVNIAGVVIVVDDARQAMGGEADGALQLAAAALDAAPSALSVSELHRLQRALDAGRHLCARLEAAVATGAPVGCTAARGPAVPAWFLHLVGEPGSRASPVLSREWFDGTQALRLVVAYDAADELTEAWSDARRLLLLPALMAACSHLGVLWLLWRWLEPVTRLARQFRHGDAARLPDEQRLAAGFGHLQKRAERGRELLRRMAGGRQALVDAERARIAAELHDDLAQYLAALQADVGLIRMRCRPTAPGLTQALEATEQDLAALWQLQRSWVRRLDPRLETAERCTEALQQSLAALQLRHPQLDLRWRGVDALPWPASPAARMHLFRIIQEAVLNACRHARARRIRVLALVDGQGALRIRISDDGRGIGAASGGSGMHLQRQRARLINAGLQVHGQPGRGTKVEVRVPAVATACRDDDAKLLRSLSHAAGGAPVLN